MITNFRYDDIGLAFLSDRTSDVKLLKGPAGCGKSSIALVSMVDSTLYQKPCFDGVRRSKWVIVRDTYANLHDTTVPTWQSWFPSEYFGRPIGQGRIYHTLTFPGVEIQLIFMALERPEDVVKLKSLEATGFYLNECQFIKSPALLTDVLERTMRYPSRKMGGGLGKRLVIADCNPPKTNHWIYHFFERQKRSGWTLFDYPPAVVLATAKDQLKENEYAIDLEGNKWKENPDAEYTQYTSPPGYWLNNARGAATDYIKVNLCGEYGTVQWGHPVHPEFNDSIQYSRADLKAIPNLSICLGWDFGNTPACVVIQRQPDGRIFVLDEFPTVQDFLRPFLSDTVIPVLDKKYPWWRNNHVSRHDPSGMGSTADGKTASIILKEHGVISKPAASNSVEFRRDALKYFLTRMIKGEPGFLLSEGCHTIREGLLGDFHYEVLPTSRWDKIPSLKPVPKKNHHSHVCEALEYAFSEYRPKKMNSNDEAVSKFEQKFAESAFRTAELYANRW